MLGKILLGCVIIGAIIGVIAMFTSDDNSGKTGKTWLDTLLGALGGGVTGGLAGMGCLAELIISLAPIIITVFIIISIVNGCS